MDKHVKEQPFPLGRENIIPFALEKRRSELNELVQNYPIYIPVEKLSKFLGMKPEALRACLRQGHCPFGVAYSVGSRYAYKIFTATFVTWYLKTCA